MKKQLYTLFHTPYLLILFFLFSMLLIGCTDNRYRAEKLFWEAQEKLKRIVKESGGKLKDKDYPEIIAAFKKVSDTYPLEPLAAKTQFFIARMYLAQGKYDDAHKELKSVIHNFSSQAEIAAKAYYAIGKIYEAHQKWEDARQEYEKIIDLYPLTSLGLKMPLYIMQHYQLTKNKEELEKAYRQALRNYSGLLDEYADTSITPVIKQYVALTNFLTGKLDEAIDVWDDIVSKYPQSLEAMKSLLAKAGAYYRKKNIPKSIEVYKEFVKRYPQTKITGQIRLVLGWLYLRSANVDKAKEIFSGVLTDYPDNKKTALKAYIGLSQCYRKEADTEKLLKVYETIQKEYPDTPVALMTPFSIAQYYMEMKYQSKADEAFQKAIDGYRKLIDDPQTKNSIKRVAANFLTLCYLKKNEADKAVKMLRILVDKHPSDPVYLLNLASLYRSLHSSEKALRIYKEILEKYPDNRYVASLAKRYIKMLEKEN